MAEEVPLPLATLLGHISMKSVEVASCGTVVALVAAHAVSTARGRKSDLGGGSRGTLVRGVWMFVIPSVAVLAATRIAGYAEPRYDAIADRAFALQHNEGQLAVDSTVLAAVTGVAATGPFSLQRLSWGIAAGVLVGTGISAWRRANA
jgi:hypothetical protein